MTESEFLSLSPRERDALVAENVMGFLRKKELIKSLNGEEFLADVWIDDDNESWLKPDPYTTHILFAWEVVEKMKELPGRYYKIDYIQIDWCPKDEKWMVSWVDNHESTRGDSCANTAPLAISIAALKAKGVIT